MNDVVSDAFGMMPSLHESRSTLSKSRFRVSRTPIICTPSSGSPWNGTEVVLMSCERSLWSVVSVTSRIPSSISFFSLLMSVNVRKSDSVSKALFGELRIISWLFSCGSQGRLPNVSIEVARNESLSLNVFALVYFLSAMSRFISRGMSVKERL